MLDEAPSKLSALRSQRIRWHVGLIDNLRLHRAMLGRRFGRVGGIALPYAILFEAVAPVIGLVGSVLVVGLLVFGGATWWFVVALALAAVLLGQIQTAGAILVEEVGLRRYRSRDLLLLGLWSVLELFWYRPLTLLWRVWAMVLLLVGRRPEWGTIPRARPSAPVTGTRVRDAAAAALALAPALLTPAVQLLGLELRLRGRRCRRRILLLEPACRRVVGIDPGLTLALPATLRAVVGQPRSHRLWITASTLLPSGSSTNAA